ncbi:MAG: tetraacyldisaccharide 4'-kinase [Rickettsiales bacterium]|jgi:tetraacyldisaccharide 4'-kinase|nr:tetraacyldisaccharide 4'-kinase [Rickettsiales bacterium]
MKAPNFWKNDNFISFILTPLTIFYNIGRHLHVLFSIQYKSKLKIICVGNVNVGGSGKTPVALKIGKTLKEKKVKFAYLSKGYKGSIKDLTKVSNLHDASEVGDEPLLLAEIADTYICQNRKKAIRQLEKDFNYDVIVMDDGMQNPTIFKNKNIVVVDGNYAFGNERLMPAGPLRETIGSMLKRVSFFIIIGQDSAGICDRLYNKNLNVVRGVNKVKNEHNLETKYMAFSGIGIPSKFLSTLRENRYKIENFFWYDDHYFYTENDLKKLELDATDGNCKLITTKKDWIKLSAAYKEKIEYLDVEIEFYDNEKFVDLLMK